MTTAVEREPQARTAARRRLSRRRALRRALYYVVAALLALWVLAPIYLITVTAFSEQLEVYEYPKRLVPDPLSTDTLSFFVGSTGVTDALVNSVIVALITLALSTAIGAPAGYAIARHAFRGRDVYQWAILSTRAFPVVILSIPLAVTFINWGIYDTVIAVALMHTALALPFTVLITSSVFFSIPREYEEAAKIHGATPLAAFVRVVLPLALPGLAAASMFTLVLSWNEVFAAVILTVENRTLPAHVLSLLTESPQPFRFAAAWFMLAPALVFIFVIRRYLLGLWGVR
jgi:multiple sugar transport system permease protein